MWGLHELAWCAWCRLGEAKDSTPHRHSNGAQNTLRDQYGYARVCVGGMECGLVVAEVSWGCAKSVVNLANFSHAHANPTIPQQIACLCEDLSLQATQGRAVCMDKLTQKRKFRW